MAFSLPFGQYGGAAFLIPYILFIVLFGFVGLSAEFAIGRLAKTELSVHINIAGSNEAWENKVRF